MIDCDQSVKCVRAIRVCALCPNQGGWNAYPSIIMPPETPIISEAVYKLQTGISPASRKSITIVLTPSQNLFHARKIRPQLEQSLVSANT
jgi:hypothetical protein